MEFLVADAERLFAEGGKVKNLSFWGYKIMTRSTLPSYQTPPLFPRVVTAPPANFISGEGYVDYCTWHRYSDFEWLVAQLQHVFPGTVFPPIPEKAVDGTKDKLTDLFSSKDAIDTSRDNELVQKRIRQLQLFFDFIGQLPQVFEIDSLKAFVSMEEPEWLVYKEKKAHEVKPGGWDAVKSKGLGFLSKLGSIGDKKPVAFPEGSPIAAIRTHQQALGDSLRAASMHMAYLRKYAHATPELKSETADDSKTEAGASSIKMLPPTLVYNGHFVCEVNDRTKQGVVRHVEGNSAWIDWGTGEPLARIPVHQLCYPFSGVSDPTVFAANEIVSQIDSFCTYLSLRPEARQLERLTDLLFFWSKYCHEVVHTIEGLQLQLEDLVLGEKDLSKKKEGADKVELAARVAVMKNRYETGCAALLSSVQALRVPQRKALLDIAFLYGGLSINFLGDDEWESRLQRADAALPLLFEPPQEVVDSLTQDAKAAHFVEYVAQPQAPPQQYQQFVAPPPAQQQPPAYQQPPVQRSPEAAPAAAPAAVSQSRFAHDDVFATAPPDDVMPPPPPPVSEVVNRPGPSRSGIDDNWQAQPRSWSENPPVAVDDAVPPPPPIE